MNLYDSAINLEDEDLILSLKGQDLSGWQKIANILDCIRALHRINKQSFWYGRAQDYQDCNEPYAQKYLNCLAWLQKMTEQEPKSWVPSLFACTLEVVIDYRKLVDTTLENSVVADNNTFTGPTALARQLLPVLQALQDSLEAMFEEAQFNTVGREDFDARSLEVAMEDEYLFDLQRQFEYLAQLAKDETPTFKSLLGANLEKVLSTAARFYKTRGQTLTQELKENKLI